MVWSDFEVPQSFIVENSKQRINLNTVCVTNVTFQVSNNSGIFKQALENSPNEFRGICGLKDVAMRIFQKQLKIKQPVMFEGPRAKTCGNKILESSLSLKKF